MKIFRRLIISPLLFLSFQSLVLFAKKQCTQEVSSLPFRSQILYKHALATFIFIYERNNEVLLTQNPSMQQRQLKGADGQTPLHDFNPNPSLQNATNPQCFKNHIQNNESKKPNAENEGIPTQPKNAKHQNTPIPHSMHPLIKVL